MKPIAKARPRQKPTVTLTSVSIPVHERKLFDIKTQRSHISVKECQKPSPDCYDMINQSLEEATERSDDASQLFTWRLDINSGRRRRSEEKISILRVNAVDPALQDNVLLPKGFTEYIYHVGNANELNSIIRKGLIPGGKSLKRGRQAVFSTTVNPMEDVHGMGQTPCDLTKPRIAPYKNIWKRLQNTVFWCKLKLAQERGLQFYQTRTHAVVL